MFDNRFLDELRATLAPFFAGDRRWLVGLSGGGDSVAFVRLIMDLGYQQQVVLGHFNHRWSAWGDAAEAWIYEFSQTVKLPLVVGYGEGKPATNAEEMARVMRYNFFKNMSLEHDLAGIMVAHTRTDVAENFLIRAGKGSGMKGLAAMTDDGEVVGARVVRPLLHVGRDELRMYLRGLGQDWLEDPDTLNQRARVRALRESLDLAGITEHGLAASAHALKRQEMALSAALLPLFKAHMTMDEQAQTVTIARTIFSHFPEEIGCRFLACGQTFFYPQAMTARTQQRLALVDRISREPHGKAPLAGVVWSWRGDEVVGRKEP